MAYTRVQPAQMLAAETFRAAFHAAPLALALIEQGPYEPEILTANEAFLQLMQRSAVAGRTLRSVFRAAAATQVSHAVEHCLLVDGGPACLRIAHAPAGKVLRLEIEIRRFTRLGHAYVILSASPMDRRLTLAELGEAGVLAELGALSRGLVYIHDVVRGRVRHSRHPLVAKLGLPGHTLTLEQVKERIHPDDLQRFGDYAAEQTKAPDDRVSKGTFRIRAADGGWMWINIRSRVFARDAEGAAVRIIGFATDVTDAHEHAAAMAAAAESLAHAEVNERRRIGRELHDSTSQLLVAARLALSSLERRATLDPDAARNLNDARQAITSAQEEIRNFSYVLHPPSLPTEGLEGSLRSFAAGFSRRTGLDISVSLGRAVDKLPSRVELALFRVTQEALMNVYRHAKASRAAVRLRHHGGVVELEVEDDGVGMPDAAIATPGVGISGMQARMVQLGGGLTLGSHGKGLLLKVSAPVRAQLEV